MRTITPAQASLLYALTTTALKELLCGDWETVRQEVADLHELLAVLARLQS